MGAELALRLPTCFRRLAGAVLQLSADGVVLDSNGVLEGELGRELRGRPFAEILDPASSRRKWDRILALASDGPRNDDVTWELILVGRDSLPEPRPFSVLWDADAQLLWLIEHRPDPRLDALREQVTEVNSELANTQRELLKERGRLAHALETTERLSDILRERNDELERSNAALDEFAHVVSHDLKAPLRSIANYAAWIEEDALEQLSGEIRSHLERLRNRIDRMRVMIEGVLAYARAGRERARPESLRVADLLREVLELLDPPEEVAIEIEPVLPTLVTERAPLRQVFLNLIGNAMRYARRSDPARVRVGARDAGELHEFFVQDNGPGIPPRLQDKIWALFRTLEPEERAEGTGIGLAVVKKLVEAHGGRVWVESEPGGGATFRFLWPKGDRPAAGSPADEPATKERG
jgi:signal transduction histidine kinase